MTDQKNDDFLAATFLRSPRALTASRAKSRRESRKTGAQVGLAYVDLASGDTLFLNADTSFHAASTMKVPVMIELFRRATTGSFRMTQGCSW